MAFNFTFADNQRLGLQIVGANSTGTSEQPLCFKRAVVDENNVAGEVMYVGRGRQSSGNLGLCCSFTLTDNKLTINLTAGTPIFGVAIQDDNLDYIQTGGVAYVQVDSALTKGAKIYLIASSRKISAASSGNIEIKGGIALDPKGKISVNIKGVPTDLYPVLLNNPHL